MAKKQKAIIVNTGWADGKLIDNIDILNKHLSEGWIVLSQGPMGSGDTTWAYSLVIMEKREENK
ncbi:MAG TPA: hypothetical protein PKK26_09860 [Candidatus Wallbacteria bacterium]|nr:hypothetical protein [Candidatus Wallbacteria bacterium]